MTTAPAGSPYKGLAPFGDTDLDATLFFGRERDVEVVCANVVASRLTVLYGSSGVGKSSLLAAAVARRLRELPEHPVVVVFSTWSERPGAAIAAALCEEAGVEAITSLAEAAERASEARGDVYLLLDQSEEYFLYHPDGSSFEDELAGLLRGPARVNVLLSLREDALAKLDRFKAAIPGILDNYLRLDRLTPAAGRDAVVRPLVRWHELGGPAVEAEPELVGRVLDEVVTGRIGVGVGGTGAVAGSAGEERIEAPYLQLVMERLWEVEQQAGSSTLRLATLEDLGGAEQIVAGHLRRAMDALAPAQQELASALLRQLVTPSGAKIAHAVPDLAGYAGVPEDEVRALLDALANRRIVRPGDDGRYEIYHDVLAAPILAWRARYVQGQALREAHRRNRRLALVAGAAVAGLVVMALVAVFALVQRSNARSDARAAHARELDAAAVSLLPSDPELGLLLARDSAVLSPTPTAEEVLRQALAASRVRRIVVVGSPVLDASLVADAVLVAGADGRVLRVTADKRHTVATGRPAIDASIAPPGEVLLTGRDGRLRLVSGSRVEVVPRVSRARGASLSGDGATAVVRFAGAQGHPSPVVRLVAVRTGRVLQEVRHDGPATAAALGPRGTLLATGGEDRVIRIWNAQSGALVRVLRGHVGPIAALAFSPRATLFASASTDGEARVWNLGDGRPVSVLSGHANFLDDIAFSPDGEQVVTASRDRTAKTWKAETGALLATYSGAGEAVTSASFGRDGLEIVTGSDDGRARVWDAVVQPELSLVASLGSPVTAIAFVNGGRELAATAGGRSYRIALPHGRARDVGPAAAVPTVVTGAAGDRARITGKTITVTHRDGTSVVLRGHKDRVTSVAFSPDGSRVLTASWDHDARVWDAATGAPLQVLRAHFAVVSDARYSPDGRWIVTAGPGTAGLWSTATGALISYFRGHEGRLLSAAFAPDSRRFATGGVDGTVRYYRCTVCGGVDELVAIADTRLAGTGRVPTEAERQHYGLP